MGGETMAVLPWQKRSKSAGDQSHQTGLRINGDPNQKCFNWNFNIFNKFKALEQC
jgi:hypothetical protein